MVEEFFELAVEGTTLCDLFLLATDKKIVVVDKSGNYGTTYPSVVALSKSPYISDFKILKSSIRNVRIEAVPFVLGLEDRIVDVTKRKMGGGILEYICFNDIYFFSDTVFKFPGSKNDIANMNLSNNDKFHLASAIRECDVDILKHNFSNKHHPIYRALVELDVFRSLDFRKYCSAFGGELFIYPLYGLSEITETLCMSNAFKGVTYVVNGDLQQTECDNKEYTQRFTCELGIVNAKQILKSKIIAKTQWVRVVLTQQERHNGCFIGFIERPMDFTVSDQGNIKLEASPTTVIGINSAANICEAEHQLVYFVNESGPIADYELGMASIDDKDVLLDITFKVVVDIDEFKRSRDILREL